jgi:prepilin-type N-terminal cleavage/methylation domain-containing protein
MANLNMEKKSNGFTLIELIVVIAVFLLIIGGAIGIFLSIISHQRRILYEQELLNQTSYIEEHMSKALRTATKDPSGNCLGIDYVGYSYLLTRPVTVGANTFFTGIKFLNQSDTDNLGVPKCEEFFLENAIPGNSSTPLVLKEIRTDSPYTIPGSTVPLSSQKLIINSIRFGIDGFYGKNVAGSPVGDQDIGFASFQPRITIVLNIQIQGDTQQPTRIMQTTVSQRNLNIK